MRWVLRLAPLLGVPALVVVLAIAVVLRHAAQPAGVCGVDALTVVPAAGAGAPGVPGGAVAGYSGAQLAGAGQIMRAGADHGVSVYGQTIGVMTSMGESGLTAVAHGDAAGPDSLCWFQQRAPWGPAAARCDPYASATMFFTGGQGGQRGLLGVPGWESMTPTLAAHAVQRNADPNHYARFWPAATAVVAALGGGIAPAAGPGDVACQDTEALAGSVTAQGWTKPAVGRFSSGFGPRGGAPHNGIDLAAPLGTPVVAAADGIVVGVCLTNSSPCTGYGTLVTVDHGGGVLTRYAHATPTNVLVTVGQRVKAGDQLTRIGTYGDSTGPHLHFELLVGGAFADPVPFLRARGVELGAAG